MRAKKRATRLTSKLSSAVDSPEAWLQRCRNARGGQRKGIWTTAAEATFSESGADQAWLEMLVQNPTQLERVIGAHPDLPKKSAKALVEAVTKQRRMAGMDPETVTASAKIIARMLVARGFFPPNFVQARGVNRAMEQVVWVYTKKAAAVYNPAYDALERRRRQQKLIRDTRQRSMF